MSDHDPIIEWLAGIIAAARVSRPSRVLHSDREAAYQLLEAFEAQPDKFAEIVAVLKGSSASTKQATRT